ncbi:MAG: transposase zinc-binding domain-containing protein, partial [Burkholderiales bacterium]
VSFLALSQLAFHYRPRRPENRILSRLFRNHLHQLRESFTDEDGTGGLPSFVEKEIQRFLDCGRPELGFIRLKCERCGVEHALPFSCKQRTLCSSCGARRMEHAS